MTGSSCVSLWEMISCHICLLWRSGKMCSILNTKLFCNVIKFREELKTSKFEKNLENFSLSKALKAWKQKCFDFLKFHFLNCKQIHALTCINISVCVHNFHFKVNITLLSGRVQLTDWSNCTKAVSEEQG